MRLSKGRIGTLPFDRRMREFTSRRRNMDRNEFCIAKLVTKTLTFWLNNVNLIPMKSLQSHPKLLWALAFGNACNTLSYFGTEIILILYVMHVFHFSSSESYIIYGAYTAFIFITPTLGGIIADRWLGSRETLFLGGTLVCIGNIMMVFPHHFLFSLGLALSLVGAGLYKCNSSAWVGKLYPENHPQKESAFTLVYLAVNIGGTLAPILYGLIVYHIGWNFGFLAGAAGMFMSLILFICLQKQEQSTASPLNNKIIAYFVMISTCLLLGLAFYTTKLLNILCIILFISGFAFLIIKISKYSGKERSNLIGLFILNSFVIFCFSAGMQVGSTMILFLQHEIHQGTLHINLPASVFGTLYSLFVLLLAPFLSLLWKTLKGKNIYLHAPEKLVITLFLGTLGISCFAFAAITHFILTGIILGILFLSAGELIVTPALYAAMSNHSPSDMKSTMMGGLFLFVALGGYLSGISAKTAGIVSEKLSFTSNHFAVQFCLIALMTFTAFIILLFFVPMIKRLLRA
jgi:POT family proton-dependent oligopeptide transporter